MEKTKNEQGRKGQKGRRSKHDISFKRNVANEYRNGDLSLPQLAKKYNVRFQAIHEWVQEFSSEIALNVEENVDLMTESEQKDLDQLKKQNAVLKKKLDHEQMRNFALETMIDLAKEQMGIDLRKNSGAKQPKK